MTSNNDENTGAWDGDGDSTDLSDEDMDDSIPPVDPSIMNTSVTSPSTSTGPSPVARRQSRLFAHRLELLAGRSSPDSERVDGMVPTFRQEVDHEIMEDVEIVQEDIGIRILTESHTVRESSDEESVGDIDVRPVEASDGYVDSLDNVAVNSEVLGVSSDDEEPYNPLHALQAPVETPAVRNSPTETGGPPSTSSRGGKRFRFDGFSSSSEEDEENFLALPTSSPPTRPATLPPISTTTRSSPVPGPSRTTQTAPPANFERRRFLRQMASSPERELPSSRSSTESSRIRVGLARDLLRALTDPVTTSPTSGVPSLPNTTIRRILSVNTSDLLTQQGAELTQPNSPNIVPSIYSPVTNGLNTIPVTTPRYEPTVSESERLWSSAREVQNIDRILQLSRRSRELRQDLSVSSPKRPRQSDQQYKADLAEALQRSLSDSVTVDSSHTNDTEPQPGCSHWQSRGGDQINGTVLNGNNTGTPLNNTENGTTSNDVNISPAANVDESNENLDTPSNGNNDGDAPTEQPNEQVANYQAGSQGRNKIPSDRPNFEELYRTLLETHTTMVTDLQSSIECPICLDTIREAPVICCKSGHVICSTCSARTFSCPTCRAPMSLASGQRCVSHTANKLVDILPHPCTNKDSGCPEEKKLSELRTHEAECRYRQIRCPVNHCLITLPMAHLEEHVASFPHLVNTLPHPPNPDPLIFSRFIVRTIQPDTRLPGNFTLRSFDPLRFTYDGIVFYLQTISSPDKRLLYHFIQLEGTKKDCTNYWATISVGSFNPNTPYHVCQTIQPTPLDLHCRDDLFSIGEALVMTERAVVTILQYDSTHNRYQFKIEVNISESGNSKQ